MNKDKDEAPVVANQQTADDDNNNNDSDDEEGKSRARPRSGGEPEESEPKKRGREKSPEEEEELGSSERSEQAGAGAQRSRRSGDDMNEGLDELVGLLVEIDPETRAEVGERGRPEELSQADVISRTVDLLRRLHSENEQRKLIIQDLSKTAKGGGGGGSEPKPP